MSNETTTVRIPSFFTLLTLIFVTLKLAGLGVVSTWSWWWVFSPFWIPLALAIAFVVFVGLAAILTKLLS